MSAGFALMSETGALLFATLAAMRSFCSSLRPSGRAMVGTSSSRALRSENLAGSVWLSAGAPGTTSLPLTKMSVLPADRVRARLLGTGFCAGLALSFAPGACCAGAMLMLSPM